MFDSLPFACKRNNNFGNVSIRVYVSPCVHGIILIDVTKHVIGGHDIIKCLKLLPEGTENATFFDRDRHKEDIPAGTVTEVEVTFDLMNGRYCLSILLIYSEGFEHSLVWIVE